MRDDCFWRFLLIQNKRRYEARIPERESIPRSKFGIWGKSSEKVTILVARCNAM